jgi:ATP diphosphatase
MMKEKYSIDDLLCIMDELRNPDTGCPWDLKQTFASIAKFTLEEAYEVVDAIEQNDVNSLKGELGDLLYQVVFYAKLGKEQELFEFNDIIDLLARKLVRRHPHVFGEIKLHTDIEVEKSWQKEKMREREEHHQTGYLSSALDDIPKAFPALVRANKIQQRAAAVNFDFESYKGALSKVYEEVGEVVEEAEAAIIASDKLEEELGDLLFSVVNLTRHLQHDPEQALRKANEKFEKRFRQVEALSLQNGKSLCDCSISEMELYWQKVK